MTTPRDPATPSSDVRSASLAPDLPTQWKRLHGLSPVLRSARAITALGTVIGTRQLTPGQHPNPWIDLAVVGLAVVAGTVSWLVTRWRIHGSELQIETGWIRRQSVRVPLTRLQAVDVVRPLLGRWLGLAEVRLVVAGGGSSRTKLAYLSEARADEVRAQLLALSHGLGGDTPAPPARPVLTVPARRLLAANALTPGPFLVLILLGGSLLLVVTSPALAAALVGTTIALGVAFALASAHRIGAEWDFALAEAPDGLRLQSGLLQTRAETIPHGRVQAVRWVEPLLWRGLGWVRLEVDVARRHDRDRSEQQTAATTRALLPVGTVDEARWVLSRVLPDVEPWRRGRRAPGRARWRAPFSRHNLEAWYDDRHVVCAGGRLRRAVVVVPLEKVQSLRWTQGPVSRALRLATVRADTAGRRFPGAAPFRDASEAREWLLALPDLCRAARQAAVKR